MRLIGYSFSPYCQRAHVASLLKGAPITFVDAGEDEAAGQEAEQASPLGTLPVLIGDGIALGDSLAIAQYIDKRWPGTSRLWPEEAIAVARAFEVTTLVDCVLVGTGDLAVRYKAFEGHPEWDGIREMKMGRIQGSLDRLSAIATAPSLTGDGFGAAEAWLACAILWLGELPRLAQTIPHFQKVVSLGYSISPSLLTWATQHRGRPEIKTAMAAVLGP